MAQESSVLSASPASSAARRREIAGPGWHDSAPGSPAGSQRVSRPPVSPAEAPHALAPKALDRWARRLVHQRLQRLNAGRLVLVDRDGAYCFGDLQADEPQAELCVHSPRFYRRVLTGGSLGAAEAYLQGDWTCDDLPGTLQLLARNAGALQGVERGPASLVNLWRRLWHWLRRNSHSGSRRNIAAHYDLSNEFFALFLDDTLTYSSGYFATAGSSLREASLAKYDRVCRKLELGPQDHLLEIGSGWGGFAIHAAGQYGCRVTTTTISQQQFELARQRIAAAGLGDRITLLLQDYRDLQGQYDKLASIEMVEAVGHQYLGTFFRQCSDRLRPGGRMVLQAITIPDGRYEAYRRSVDFIQRYIFPGGCLPCTATIGAALQQTEFRLLQWEDFGPYYARTLSCWRANFWEQIARVRQLGYGEEFIRMWDFYLSYCEAGFREQQIGVCHVVLER